MTNRCRDVGCGDGYVSRLVVAQLPRGSAPGVAPHGPGRTAAPGTDVRFAAGDVLDRLFRSEFDLVCSVDALHRVLDQATASADLCRAVRDDRRLLLAYIRDEWSGTPPRPIQPSAVVGRNPRRRGHPGLEPLDRCRWVGVTLPRVEKMSGALSLKVIRKDRECRDRSLDQGAGSRRRQGCRTTGGHHRP